MTHRLIGLLVIFALACLVVPLASQTLPPMPYSLCFASALGHWQRWQR